MPPLGSADLVLVREAASRALGPAEPARLLAGVVRGAARLCGARLASIALLTERRDHLELRSVFGTGGVIAEKRLPVRQSLNGTVIASDRSFQRLAPRERDILALLMADHTCTEVAAALELSDHTVRHHVERLKLRFGKATLHGLLGLLIERHLLD